MLPLSITENLDQVLSDRAQQAPQLIKDLQQAALAEWENRGRVRDPIACKGIRDNLLHKITEEVYFTWHSIRDHLKANPNNYSRSLENDIKEYLDNQKYLNQLIETAKAQLENDKVNIYKHSDSVKSITLVPEIDKMKNEIFLEVCQFVSELKNAYIKRILNIITLVIVTLGVIAAFLHLILILI